jgi:ATP-dependent DNA helicase RecQ
MLAKFDIIEYEKQNGLPKITLLTPRANIDNLPITWSEYLQKKERSKLKIDAVESYVRDFKTCRTRKISAYFGEDLSQNCGICDTCIQRKKEQKGAAFPEGLESEQKLILNYLKNGPMTLDDLTDCLRPLTRTEAAKVIQYCLESGQIAYTSADTIALASS